MAVPGAVNGLELLSKEFLVQTGPVDHAGWNFNGVLGYIQRRRFHLILSLIGNRRFSRLLEIGFGSGIFLPSLARRSDELHGIDVHQKNSDVAAMLAKANIACHLECGDGKTLPYADASFDAVVAVSVLEFIEDLDATCLELRRILRPNGRLFVVTPGRSPVLDLGLYILTGASAKNDFADRRSRIVPTLLKHFEVAQRLDWPLRPALGAHVYSALELRKRAL